MKALWQACSAAALLLLGASLCAAQGGAAPGWWAQQQALAQRDGYRLLRPAQLKALYDQKAKMVVLDARTVYEYRAGHLPQARNLEFHMGHAHGLDQAMRQKLRSILGPDSKARVVIYDQGLQCVRGQLAAQWAVNLGYENVWQLPEGWIGWTARTQTQAAGQEAAGKAGAGDAFPGHRFTLLDKKHDSPYLGLGPDAAGFEFSDLKAEYVLVELYSELCLACQESVKVLSRARELIGQDPDLAARLKLLGIGVGSRNREVHRYQKENQVTFPLFSDPERALHKSLGEPALPALYLLKLGEPTGPRIIAVLSGPLGQAPDLLKRIRQHLTATVKP